MPFLTLLLFFATPFALAGEPAALCEPASFAEAHAETVTVPGCFWSAAARKAVRYEVTFPAGYNPEKAHPFVIFLHGRGGDEKQFREFGGARAIDEHVAQGGIPFVAIAPAEPHASYWKDGPADEFGTAKMISQDLVQHMESMPGIAAGDRSQRGIMGLSMGGHGSLYVAQKNPRVFSAVYAMSPVFRGPEELLPEDVLAFGTGQAYLTQDPVSIYKSYLNAGESPLNQLWSAVEIGRDDPFLTSSPRTRNFLEKLQGDWGNRRVNLSRPGAHEDQYWARGLRRAADFFGSAFEGKAPAVFKTDPACAERFERLAEPLPVYELPIRNTNK